MGRLRLGLSDADMCTDRRTVEDILLYAFVSAQDSLIIKLLNVIDYLFWAFLLSEDIEVSRTPELRDFKLSSFQSFITLTKTHNEVSCPLY